MLVEHQVIQLRGVSMFGKNSAETQEDVVKTPVVASPVISNNHEESDDIIAFVGEEVTF